VPILSGSRLLGKVMLYSSEPRAFADAELEVAATFANQVAVAVERQRLQEIERFRLHAAELLGSSLDYESTLEQLAELAVPFLSDLCLIDLVDKGGDGPRRFAAVHADPAIRDEIQSIERRYPPDPNGNHPALTAMRTGKVAWDRDMPDEFLRATTRDEEHYRLVKALGFRSYICAPLISRERVLGTISLVVTDYSGRRYEEGDLAIAGELASHAAAAIDNARLFQAAEEQARASEALAHIGDGVFLVGRDGEVRLWNPAAAAITGLAEKDVVGKRVEQVLPDWTQLADRIIVAESGAQVTAAPSSLPLEVDGRELWISISGASFPDGIVYAFRDVGAETELARLASDYVATISHELRTPLAAVYGATTTLAHRHDGLSETDRAQLLDMVCAESERMRKIIDEILLATRLESGRAKIEQSTFDLREAAEAAVQRARSREIGGRTIRFSADGPLLAVGDPNKTAQVLNNLMDNAIKYSGESGRIEVLVEAAPEFARCTVQDDGIGIPAGEERRIFEKFYRVDASMSGGVGGTGLGLYIARELVIAMGGQIGLGASEGPGTCFYFELPRA
jgi:PAS domain S-box-containing protein